MTDSETLDHTTDILAVLTIGTVAIAAEPTMPTLAALTSIALGKRVLLSRK